MADHLRKSPEFEQVTPAIWSDTGNDAGYQAGASPAWEPWTPKIGQRVRVRLSGECTARLSGSDPSGRVRRATHRDEEYGRTGVVMKCPYIARDGYCDQSRAPGHPYFVLFDEPILSEHLNAAGGHYAAIELEPALACQT